jgi:serine O-acetyltransferase
MSIALARKLFNKKKMKGRRYMSLRETMEETVEDIMEVLYPHFYQSCIQNVNDLAIHIQKSELKLCQLLRNVLNDTIAKKLSKEFFRNLGKISDRLDKDAEAILAGDPAAESLHEIIVCYPGFFAIAVHRMANFFYLKQIPIIPRMLSEHAHKLTGVDIHPGATIGDSFFIDHGTGIVIGETTVIGKNVKIYQGVTLGALSVNKKLKSKKRHPTIEDNCIVYSNATILGGDVVIGKNSIIGGNVWVTKSIPENSIVYNKSETKMASPK